MMHIVYISETFCHIPTKRHRDTSALLHPCSLLVFCRFRGEGGNIWFRLIVEGVGSEYHHPTEFAQREACHLNVTNSLIYETRLRNACLFYQWYKAWPFPGTSSLLEPIFPNQCHPIAIHLTSSTAIRNKRARV